MPSWSDENGRCQFILNGIRCCGGEPCPMHSSGIVTRKRATKRDKALADAYRRGAEAMRDECAQWVADYCSFGKAAVIRALPIPEDPDEATRK